MNVANIQPKDMKGLETVFQIDLRVFNTNDVPVEIKGIDCRLELNGKHFASGVSNRETSIPSYGTALLPITVYSSVLDMVKGAVGLQGKEKLKYKISGKVRLGSGTIAPSVIPFKSEGELSLEGLPKALDPN
jgi:LEA14-like dessication related protein